MAGGWFKKNKSSGLAVFTGFKSVRVVNGLAGGEKFGLVELAPEYAADIFTPPADRRRPAEYTGSVFTAALQLGGPGLNRWLAEAKDDQAFYVSLCQSLPPDSPSQFLLRRRRSQLGPHYDAMQQQALQRLPDEEIARFFLQDYLDNLIYPVEDSGLAELWCGLLISGRSDEEVTDRMARLLATLPCDARPCQAAELSKLLLEYFAPGLAQTQAENGEATDTLYAEWLSEVPFEVVEESMYNGQRNAYWTLSAPPLKHEGGWTRRLLENEVLTNTEFDISVHLAPAYQESTMQEVLNRRLAMINEGIEAALDAYHRPEADELREQQREIEDRLYGLVDEQHRYFEIGITLSLRADPDIFDEECQVFEGELRQCGLAAHRTMTVSQTQSAMLDCAPLNISRFDRPFVLPAPQAGHLLHLGTVGQPLAGPTHTLVGLSPAGETVYLDPAARPGQTACFLLGEPGQTSAKQAGALVRYMAGLRWFKGGAVFGLDRKGEWQWLVTKQGGRYINLGASDSGYSFNPLEVTADGLSQISQLEGWVTEIGGFLSAILELDDERREDLSAVLVEAALARVNRNEEINPASLWIRAESSGYLPLAERLRQLGHNGRYGWLAQPTRLPLPGHEELLFLGLSEEVRRSWSEDAQRYYWSRLFARLAALGGAHVPTRPYLFLINDAHELLTDPTAARSLSWTGQQAARLNLSLWLLAPRADDWINSHTGRNLFERAQTQLYFNQTGPGLAGAARRLGLSQRFVKAVRDRLPGAAVVRQLDEDGQPTLFAFDPLPGEFVDQLASAPSNTVVRPDPVVRPKPIEVPLFAPDEIFDADDLEPTESFDPFDIPEWPVPTEAEPIQPITYAAG